MKKHNVFSEINKELENVLNNCIESSNELENQDEKINNFNFKLIDINNKIQTSKWHLNNISATFSKMYKKLNIKSTTKDLEVNNKNNINSDINLTSIKNQQLVTSYHNIEKKKTQDELQLISDKLDDIYNISIYNNNLIKQQNKKLEVNSDDIVQQSQNLLNNQYKISKLLK